MEEPPFKIPIDEPKAEFKKHLEPDYNKRIIFSAPFGTGKTYFLDKFFKESEEKSNYKVLHLFPVNYSVSSNEDVFELIKFDILFQLLEDDDLELKDTDFSFLASTEYFVYYKTEDIIDIFLESLAIINKPLSAVGKGLKKLAKEYSDFLKNKGIHPDKKAGHDYIKERTLTRGSAYENDLVTQLIVALIGRVTENSKQSVLIIDDLDRIDPEHIFRLLNVFAAHFDIGAPDTNKFGFDKVVFVCDITNVRNIFHAKYGTETDFTGYIDKFYSTEIFGFDNSNATIEYVSKKIFLQLKVKSLSSDKAVSHFGEGGEFRALFEYILGKLVYSNSINYRALQKIANITLNFREIIIGYERVSNFNSIPVLILNILKKVFGDYVSVLSALEKAKGFSPVSSKFLSLSSQKSIADVFIGNIIAVLLCSDDKYIEDNSKVIHTFKEYSITVRGTFFKTPYIFRTNNTFLIGVGWQCEEDESRQSLLTKDMEIFIHLFNELRKRGVLKD